MGLTRPGLFAGPRIGRHREASVIHAGKLRQPQAVARNRRRRRRKRIRQGIAATTRARPGAGGGQNVRRLFARNRRRKRRGPSRAAVPSVKNMALLNASRTGLSSSLASDGSKAQQVKRPRGRFRRFPSCPNLRIAVFASDCDLHDVAGPAQPGGSLGWNAPPGG